MEGCFLPCNRGTGSCLPSALQTPKPNKGEAITLQADIASSFSDCGTTHWVHFIAESGLLALSICNEVYWTICLGTEFHLLNWDFSLVSLSLRSWQESLSEDWASQRSLCAMHFRFFGSSNLLQSLEWRKPIWICLDPQECSGRCFSAVVQDGTSSSFSIMDSFVVLWIVLWSLYEPPINHLSLRVVGGLSLACIHHSFPIVLCVLPSFLLNDHFPSPWLWGPRLPKLWFPHRSRHRRKRSWGNSGKLPAQNWIRIFLIWERLFSSC